MRPKCLKNAKRNYKNHYHTDDYQFMMFYHFHKVISASTWSISIPRYFYLDETFLPEVEVWKKSFTEVRVAVEKKEAPLGIYYPEVIMRDYEHFLAEQNFEAFRNELTIAITSCQPQRMSTTSSKT